MDPSQPDRTAVLLRLWYQGDLEALEEILKLHLPWIRGVVRQRLGGKLRQKAESGDVVQDAMLRFLKDGPRLKIRDETHFRRLMTRLVENVICDQHDRFTAKRRSMDREQSLENLPPNLKLKNPALTPSSIAGRHELEDQLQLAMALLSEEDRSVIRLRKWERKSFQEIAEVLDISPSAADTRFRRAMARLAALMAPEQEP